MTKQCSRCEAEYEEPVAHEMEYVKSTDFTDMATREVFYAEVLTDEGIDLRDSLIEEHGMNITQANIALARRDDNYLDSDTFDGDEHVDYVEVEEPIGPESDPSVLKTITAEEEVPRIGSALVCNECVKETDEQLWS